MIVIDNKRITQKFSPVSSTLAPNIFLQATRAAVRFERIFGLKNRLAGRFSLTLARLKKSLVRVGTVKKNKDRSLKRKYKRRIQFDEKARFFVFL
ncbi:MAG: hypothetical protein JXI43_05800 [Tissierellales bacterium]|nr:hypothetical protein [Tissierellales bacterium]